MDQQSGQQRSQPSPLPRPVPLPLPPSPPPPAVASPPSSPSVMNIDIDEQSLNLSSSHRPPQSPLQLPQPPLPQSSPSSPPTAQPVVVRHRRGFMIAASVILLFGVIASLILLLVVTLRHKNNYSWCKEKMIVAKNGTGDFSSIAAAVKAAPNNSPSKFCIFIGQGEYNENVLVGPEKQNIVFTGDGVGNTTIKSNQTLQDTVPLATLRIKGKGFLARDLTVESQSGSGVALENMADQSIFYRCRFVGNNATVHATKMRQFYRECQIQGSHYFIFGDASAIFQRCIINATKRHPDKNIVISGQSQKYAKYKRGFVFHLCEFHTMGGVEHSPTNTYLGGPLTAYSMTVVMQSYLDASIAGWMVNSSTPYGVYFGEYNNNGPGASIRNNAHCVHYLDDSSLASQFTVRHFLNGNNWIPSFVPCNLDLI